MAKQQNKFSKELGWITKDKYNGKTTEELKKDLIRLKKHEPVDYIIGWKPFLGCKIDLSLKPLIPRPETEFWTEKVILEIGKRKVKVLDIFAGSGCIGIAVLKNCSNAKIDFADKSDACLKQIQINLKLNKIAAKKARLIKSDVLKNIKQKYDYIFANPPYIPETRKKHLSPSVLKHEPRSALFSGKLGLTIINKFLLQSKKHLNKGGQIWMEFDYTQKRAIEKIIKENEYSSYLFKKDQFNKWRFVVIT